MSNVIGRFVGRLLLQILTLVSLFLSYSLILSGLMSDNTPISIFDYGDLNAIVPAGGAGVLAIGLLLLGANLYTLKTTVGFTHWRDLPLHKKVITAIPVVVVVLGICFVCIMIELFRGYYD